MKQSIRVELVVRKKRRKKRKKSNQVIGIYKQEQISLATIIVNTTAKNIVPHLPFSLPYDRDRVETESLKKRRATAISKFAGQATSHIFSVLFLLQPPIVGGFLNWDLAW